MTAVVSYQSRGCYKAWKLLSLGSKRRGRSTGTYSHAEAEAMVCYNVGDISDGRPGVTSVESNFHVRNPAPRDNAPT